jgi:hypothetical protein
MDTLVYPGDEITTIFALERSTGNWSDTWSLALGDIGRGNGAVPSGGGVIFDHAIDREFLFSASVFGIWSENDTYTLYQLPMTKHLTWSEIPTSPLP